MIVPLHVINFAIFEYQHYVVFEVLRGVVAICFNLLIDYF